MNHLKDYLKEALTPLYEEAWGNCAFVSREIGLYILQWGRNFQKNKHEGILFVGKAPNLRTSKNPYKNKGLEALKSFGEEDLRWLKNRDTKKSAYLRVVCKICKELYKEDEWYSRVAATNLYKIAPLKADFPNTTLLKAQKTIAKEIFLKELNILSPKYVIMFSSELEKSGFLYDFQNNGNHTTAESSEKWGENNKYETKVYKIHDTIFITSPHPQGKNENTHINIIVKLLKNY